MDFGENTGRSRMLPPLPERMRPGTLSGHIGFEYVFNVPVSLSLSLEPALGIHVNRDRFGYVNTDLYRAGLAHSLLPHVGIMYHF